MLDSGIPVTIIGIDMCDGEAMWTDEQIDKLEAFDDEGYFLAKALNKIRVFYENNGIDEVEVCDPVVVLCATEEDFMKDNVKCHASCITDEGETYGQVIFYKEGFTYDLEVPEKLDYNVTLVTEVDKSGYFDRYMKGIK